MDVARRNQGCQIFHARYNIPKLGKIYQMTTYYAKWQLIISNVRKIDQMAK
jgi:hypothetical protein